MFDELARVISNLQLEVKLLKSRVEELEKLPKPSEVAEMVARSQYRPYRDTVEIQYYRTEDLIEDARKFIENTKNRKGAVSGEYGYSYAVNNDVLCDVQFNVNLEDRTVRVTFVTQFAKSFMTTNLIQFEENAIFLEDVWKAIALGKVIGLDVSDFEIEINRMCRY